MPGPDDAGPSTSSDEYAFPVPGKIKLKSTPAERASKIYRRLQKQHHHESARISRANGYAVSPPPAASRESMSPPRRGRAKPPDFQEDEDDVREAAGAAGGGYRWMGGLGQAAMDELRRREEGDRMRWLAQEELSRGDPFAGFGGGGGGGGGGASHIPKRWREAAGIASEGKKSGRRRKAEEEVDFDDGSSVPPMGEMTEEEYAAFIREGMWRRKHRDEVEVAERRRRAKEEKERQEEMQREKMEREEKRRMKRLKVEKGRVEEDRRKGERKRYKDRWGAVLEVGGEVEMSELSFNDVPWPVYRRGGGGVGVEELDKERVREFLWAIAKDSIAEGADEAAEKEEVRRVLRDAIRAFHPDRFFGRVLGRVRAEDKDMVKEGVERVSRAINDLAAGERAR